MRDSLVDHDLPTLGDALVDAGFAASHARAIFRAFYAAGGQPAAWPASLGQRVPDWIRTRFNAPRPQIVRRSRSLDGTVKLLLGLPAGGTVESVLMPGPRPDRAAACVSSQIGCAMGCDFCASTRGGLERNLTAGEIVEQYLFLKAEAASLGRRLTSLVFMGMGEPLHNLLNVIAAIDRIADPELGGLGWRQITVSTVGIVPGIDALAEADRNVHLALSLHAPDDATRSQIVPMNRRYGVADIMAAARRFFATTGRIVTIEYCLLADVNDSPAHAQRLVELMQGFRAHVNLIPYNPVAGTRHQRPPADRVLAFLATLRDASVVTHVRQPRGDDVNAACGQLRAMTPVC